MSTRRIVLVTGATGFLGRTVVRQLCKAGHSVRALGRTKDDAGEPWPFDTEAPIERVTADLTDASATLGIATGVDAIVHLAGILHHEEQDYEAVHVQGTANLLAEATRAGVRRVIHMSCFGVERESSDYQRTKHLAERVVEKHVGDWVILRPTTVYGPRDETVALLLRMVRAVPVVPLVGRGEQRVQLVWHEDVAAAVVTCLDRDDVVGRTLPIAGDEVTTPRQLVERLGTLVERPAKRFPFPGSWAPPASRLLRALGITPPMNRAKLSLLEEENVITAPQQNALRTLGITPLGLEEGLRRVVEELPEQLPTEGVGRLMHKVYEARIEGSGLDSISLMQLVRDRWQDVMLLDFHAEPQAAMKPSLGANLVANLPPRGHVHMRVVEDIPERVSLSTLSGHPIAGVVRFSSYEEQGGLYFRIDVYARASNRLDQVALQTVGRPMQHFNWTEVVRRAVKLSGGSSRDGVRSSSDSLTGAAASEAEAGLRSLIEDYHRKIAA